MKLGFVNPAGFRTITSFTHAASSDCRWENIIASDDEGLSAQWLAQSTFLGCALLKEKLGPSKESNPQLSAEYSGALRVRRSATELASVDHEAAASRIDRSGQVNSGT